MSKIVESTTSSKYEESSPLVNSTISVEYNAGTERIFIKSGKELQRSLGFTHTLLFIISLLLGSGIFVSPGLIAKETTNMGMAIMVWIIAGVPCIFAGLCYCELSCMYKKVGGEYIYISEAYGEAMGFFVVWTRSLITTPSALAILSLAIGQHLVEPFHDINSQTGLWYVRITGLISIVISTGINCISTSFTGKAQFFFTTIQTMSVLFLVALGIWQTSIGHTKNFVNMFNNTREFEIGSFGIALYNGLWSYDGWGLIASATEEIKNVEKTLWLSMITAIPFVIACYVIVNLALMSALTQKEMANSSTVATTFVKKILGKKVAMMIPFAVAFSCFASLNSTVFGIARILLSAAREGHFPYFLCFIHRNRRTPIPAVISLSLLTSFWIIMPGTDIQSLIAYFSFAIWMQYGLSLFSVIVMRVRKPDMPRPIKVWIINPICTSLFSLFLVVIPFVKKPVESSICLALSLVALPVYYVFIVKKDSLPSCLDNMMRRINESLRANCNLVPCTFDENNYQTIDENDKL